jgi:hypothetical protein
MKVNEILKSELSIKGFEFIGTVDKVYAVQERKGWYFQDIYVKDETGKIKISLSLGQDNPADTAVPESAVNKQIKAIKCGISEYNGKRSIKTSNISLLSPNNDSKSNNTPSTPSAQPGASQPLPLTPQSSEASQKVRSMSIAYAKDLVCSNSVKIGDLMLYARVIETYIINGGEIIVDDHGDIRIITK